MFRGNDSDGFIVPEDLPPRTATSPFVEEAPAPPVLSRLTSKSPGLPPAKPGASVKSNPRKLAQDLHRRANALRGQLWAKDNRPNALSDGIDTALSSGNEARCLKKLEYVAQQITEIEQEIAARLAQSPVFGQPKRRGLGEIGDDEWS